MQIALLRRLKIKDIAHSPALRTSCRHFKLSSFMMVEAKDISPSKGEDGNALAQQVTALVENGRWTICNEGKGLERQFKFKTFKATWDFMNDVAAECKKQKHHPEWSNVYNKTQIRWTTHNPEGLSTRDTSMAQFCDEASEKFGELPAESGDKKESGGGGSGITAGDCCGGKK